MHIVLFIYMKFKNWKECMNWWKVIETRMFVSGEEGSGKKLCEGDVWVSVGTFLSCDSDGVTQMPTFILKYT